MRGPDQELTRTKERIARAKRLERSEIKFRVGWDDLIDRRDACPTTRFFAALRMTPEWDCRAKYTRNEEIFSKRKLKITGSQKDKAGRSRKPVTAGNKESHDGNDAGKCVNLKITKLYV